MGKGTEGGIVLLDIKHTRQELKDRLAAVNTEVGTDWDFDKEGVSDADAKKNLGLIESAEAAIDGSVEHYNKRLEFAKGPKVVKTFE